MRLPSSVQEIANVLGTERALFLIGQLPRCYTPGKSGTAWETGKRVGAERVVMYVPKRLDFDHELVRILGWKDAQKLVQAFGGEILNPATCSSVYKPFRDEQIARLVGMGLPASTVAQWFDVSERQVRNLAREKPQEERRAANDHNDGFVTKPQRRHNDPANQPKTA